MTTKPMKYTAMPLQPQALQVPLGLNISKIAYRSFLTKKKSIGLTAVHGIMK